MRIVIDMQGVQTGSANRGIGRYTKGLVKSLLLNHREHEIILAFGDFEGKGIGAAGSYFSDLLPPDNIVVWRGVGPTAWSSSENRWRRRTTEAVREAFLRSLNPDVILVASIIEGYGEDGAFSINCTRFSIPTAVILYDLIPLIYRDAYLPTTETAQWYDSQIDHLRRADLLLAISEHSRQDGIELLELDESKVVNVSAGVDPSFRPQLLSQNKERDLRSTYGLAQPYILTAGGIEPRKNIKKLIAAFSSLPTEIRDAFQLAVLGCNDDTQLWEVGDRWPHSHGLAAGSVRALGHVPDEDLIALYSHCTLFAFPSWYEGFGFPPLEAMACGAPTIASNAACLPDIIGREDALFGPHDVVAMTEKLRIALTDGHLRNELTQWGPERARTFTWDRCAETAILAMERLCAEAMSTRCNRPQASTLELVDEVSALSQAEKPLQEDVVKLADAIAANEEQARHVFSRRTLPETLDWRIEGPFDSSYSLAIVNRELALALHQRGHNVALHSTEGPGDYPPNSAFLKTEPDIARLHKASLSMQPEDSHVVSRLLYPPRTADIAGNISLVHAYGWEETGFPQDWANDFSAYLDGMTCMSKHVEKIMIDHGVSCQICVSSIGADHWESIQPDSSYKLRADGGFRFLHVSSCFPRKGARSLLEAYGRAFSASDDVSLIIKTFENPHNDIRTWLSEVRSEFDDYPDVQLIFEDLDNEALKALYSQCHALVAPSKAEGFGLPLAEAMLSGLAVITTGWSGQRDFCDEQTAWLVDYDFERAASHFGVFCSAWANPKVDDLASKMREVFDIGEDVRRARSEAGRQRLLANFRWAHAADRNVAFARSIASGTMPPVAKTGWITTWNTPCGIAAYSKNLVYQMRSSVTVLAPDNQDINDIDKENVTRCWSVGDDDDLSRLYRNISDLGLNTIFIQFNYGFFDFGSFADFLNLLVDEGRIVIVTLHSTSDPEEDTEWHRSKQLKFLRQPFSRCARIMVHSIADLNRLKTLGLIENVMLFPHGIVDFSPANSEERSVGKHEFVVGSFGFFLPHKGLTELIEAISLLKTDGSAIRLQMLNAEYPHPSSAKFISESKNLIQQLRLQEHINMETSFLSEQEVLSRLSQMDLIVFPYQKTGESSSAAVRHGIASGTPVAVTPLPIFDDVEPAVFQLPGFTAEDIANGINVLRREVVTASGNYTKRLENAGKWRKEHSCSALGHRLDGMAQGLLRQNRGPS